MDWEHRFRPGLLLYVQVSRSAAVLHLSEHHGDGSPHGVAWFPVRDVSALHKELLARPNAPDASRNDPDAPGGPPMQVTEPNGNIRIGAVGGLPCPALTRSVPTGCR
ncbi:glyoxalase superfamily protein [Streptomyces sp. NBC_00120]|uniref:glyoxalase superfamily protein n=1 Tax=Streptomyces sp. NBC_00120 TaxID=2975660 RepID=UPI00225B9CC6|nr:glyoxalase superfamily protein [Streptomyces sp. NBC_00120]MCX5321198.1 glyoxalase superfamily protein [Streptomyces sp. NBC_00120]